MNPRPPCRATALLAATFVLSLPSAPATATKPNVVLVLADDLGDGDPSCYGEQQLPPPISIACDVNTMMSRPTKDQTDTLADERAAGKHTPAYDLDAASRRTCVGIHR